MTLLARAATMQQSAFNPLAIAGLQLWLKADAITGKNDGDAVSQWDDSSGNARHAAQATGAAQPLYKTNIINGRPAVLFDGTSDYLKTPTNFLNSNPQVLTLVAVMKPRGAGSGGGRAVAGVGANWLVGARESQGGWTCFNGGFTAPVGTVTADTPAVLSLVQSSASTLTTLRKNGASVGTRAATGAGPQGFTLGANGSGVVSEFDDSYIAELLAWNVELATSDRQAVENYLIVKYAVT